MGAMAPFLIAVQYRQDIHMDPFNRLLMAYLFANYVGHLEDEVQREASTQRHENVVSTLPEYIQTVWKKE